MFKIGEFSRIARVSCRLLRFYDEIGLLKPGAVDPTTGYRFYKCEQLRRLNRILVLRDLGLSLEQIGEVIDEVGSPEQLRAMLLLRRADVERALGEEAARLRSIEARIAQIDREGVAASDDLPDDVLMRAEPSRQVITLRETVASFAAARAIIVELAQALPRLLPRSSLGTLIAIAHSPEFEPDQIDVEIGYVLNGDPPAGAHSIGGRSMTVRQLPAVATMATCVRVGLPDQAHLITGKLGEFIEAQGYALAGPGREVFLQPPRPDRMQDSVVEMQFPVQRIVAGV
ncbi:MAG TPA: MerR family transcriptional regulator [Steroidobacteraceae bacterium]|jgi:DNA-binding transcriptional MerR regulator|nr:MerR family transcriptional regulator [Steroidobacteraceae bacterium]